MPPPPKLRRHETRAEYPGIDTITTDLIRSPMEMSQESEASAAADEDGAGDLRAKRARQAELRRKRQDLRSAADALAAARREYDRLHRDCERCEKTMEMFEGAPRGSCTCFQARTAKQAAQEAERRARLELERVTENFDSLYLDHDNVWRPCARQTKFTDSNSVHTTKNTHSQHPCAAPYNWCAPKSKST